MSRYNTSGDIDDVLPKDIIQKIKEKFSPRSFKKLGSGRYGSAYKISPKKVLKITKDLKEYEYAKRIVGIKNTHIADIYEVYHFEHNGTQYAIIIKEFCNIDEYRLDRMIDSFLEYTGGKMSLSFVSSEFLRGDINKTTFDNYFKKYKKNDGFADGFGDEWQKMIYEIKALKIYVKDFNGSNIGLKPSNGKFCIIELGLGNWGKVVFDVKDKLVF